MSSRGKSSGEPAGLSLLNLNAAGIDVGASSHFVAVPADRTEQPVRDLRLSPRTCTAWQTGLLNAGWRRCVMESTGVYWIPLFGVLEERGFQVMLVDPQADQERACIRKVDVLDWSGCCSCTPTVFCQEPSGRRMRSAACAATSGSGPCWWNMPLSTSSTCRRR